MLKEYYAEPTWARALALSPEYPVPVLSVQSPHKAADIRLNIVAEIGGNFCCDDFSTAEGQEDHYLLQRWVGAAQTKRLVLNAERDERCTPEALPEAASTDKQKGLGLQSSRCEHTRQPQQHKLRGAEAVSTRPLTCLVLGPTRA